MKLQKIATKAMAAILAASMLMTGCGASLRTTEETSAQEEAKETKEERNKENDDESAKDKASAGNALAEDLQKKYAGAGDTAEYSGNVIKVGRTDSLEIELGYNPWDTETSIFDSFIIYQDAELQYPVEAGNFDYNAETGILTVEPPFFGIAEMGSSDDVDLSNWSGSYLNDDESTGGWGTLPQYYFATNVDVETGEPLDKPVITVIKIKAEIPNAPQVTFDQTEDGLARFSWDEVPGADGYLVFTINKDEKGFWEYTNVFADTTDTSWVSEQHEFEGEILSMNSRFRQYYTSDDSEDWIEDNASSLLDLSDDVA